MALPESQRPPEKSLAEQNEELRLALIELGAEMFVNSCGQDRRTKRIALDLVDGLGTSEEFEKAVEKLRPEMPQLKEALSKIQK